MISFGIPCFVVDMLQPSAVRLAGHSTHRHVGLNWWELSLLEVQALWNAFQNAFDTAQMECTLQAVCTLGAPSATIGIIFLSLSAMD